MMDTDRIVAVVMAGGGGTRFWPRSRRARPKQFLAFDGEDSLLTQTINRLEGLIAPENTLVITGREHVEMARRHTGLPVENILGEPMGRDTAPCIGVGCLLARKMREDAIIVVLAADHLVESVEEFQQSIRRAAELAASSDAIVTMGLRPDRPATGYGYIEIGERADTAEPAAYKVERFREKPDLESARRFLLAGKYLWNSGNLVFSAGTMLEAIEKHLPSHYKILSEISDPHNDAELEAAYEKFEPISIDYGVLEHAANRVVVEATFDWDDLGTFEAVARHANEHKDKNLSRGEALFVGSEGCLVDNGVEGLVVVAGLTDVLVVRVGDALLVMPRNKAEKVKKVVQAIEENGYGHRL